jgi:exopolysaccharide biosynthesis polyprenyl glycosylphosphotransferase
VTKGVLRIFNRSVPLRTVGLGITETLLVFTTLVLAYRAGDGQHLAWAPTIYAQVGVVGSAILFCLYCFDFYAPQVTTHQVHSLPRIVQAMGLTMLIAALFHAWLSVRIEVATALFGMVLASAALTTSRYLFEEVARRPTLAEPAVVWGSGPLAASLIRELRRRLDVGVRVLGIVDYGYADDTFEGVPYLGPPEAIWATAESGQVRRMIVAIGEQGGCLPVERLMAAKAAGLNVEDGAELYEELTGKVWLGTFSISFLLFSPKFRRSAVRLFLNRTFSVFFAVIALIIASPIMLVTALLIRLDSDGPAILRQTRVGENGRHFTIYKFRSMKMGADRSSTLAPAAQDDPRCTRVGKWIRRFRLDELPQLFNILKGDMYFIGPRPFVPDQEASLLRQIPYYRQRWAVRPGATGWAQVHRGYCSSMEDNADKLSYDLFYIKNLSIGLDLLTLFKTFKVLVLGRGGR